MKTDILYLVRQSNWDQELKFSLRSLEKYLDHDGDVYICGYLPGYINRQAVKHMAYGGETTLVEKLQAALQRLPISDDFIYMCDDYVLLQPVTTEELAPAVIENLDAPGYGRHGNITEWQKMLWKTYDYCKAFGFSGYNAETHTPKVLNKAKMLATLMQFAPAWTSAKTLCDAICYETAYYNMHCEQEPVRYAYQDRVHIMDVHAETEVIASKVQGRKFLFHSDQALTGALPRFLEQTFSEKSKYEI